MDLSGRVPEVTESLTDAAGALPSLAGHASFLGQWALYRGIDAVDPARDETLWVFGAQGGAAFADNAKYLFLHVAAECPDIRPVWLSKDSEVVRELQAEGFEAYHCYSPRGLLLTLRAGVVFLTQGHRDVAMPAAAGAFAVLLWHGVPLKRISWDAGFRDLPGPVRRAHADMAREFDLLTVPGEGVVDPFASGLRVGRERMAVTGYPRNDALFGEIPGETVGVDAAALDRVQTLSTERELVFYLPTFREWTDESVADRLDLPALDAFLAERDATLVFKTHPRDRLDLPDGLANVVQLPGATDVYPFLRHADALVTDYSSVYFDYLLLDRPVVFYAYDLAEYRARRGFYFDYESVAPGPVADSFDGLLAGLDRALDPTDDADAADRAAVRTRLLGGDPAVGKSPDAPGSTPGGADPRANDAGDSTASDSAAAGARSAAVAALVRRRLAETRENRER
ncbi:CDP-glycerol glycerophosphotransferase family protein [Halorussus limi]|uniref:CDP-glycerol glycerophosphotransferase family protein n=1 Tax=Halorussus limi TaxID=2938695 RepID=A0A8U0HUM8_9EURY|nr:CDP-glycerol glycerophosphotransferase family protein [Halorussus limi]UPV74607.1 CDP-glycerol glycerophosphotransferase family protein [Halorussus limi]